MGKPTCLGLLDRSHVSHRRSQRPFSHQTKEKWPLRLSRHISLRDTLRHNGQVPLLSYRPLLGAADMHRSRINGLLIDCKVDDIDEAARFWAEALGRPVDPHDPGSRGNYRMLETPPGELSIQI